MIIIYGITLVTLAKELIAADLGFLSPFYVDDAASNGSAQQSAQLLKLLMKRGTDRGYFTEPAKFLFILDTPVQDEAEKREFAIEGLTLNFVSGSRYLGARLGLWDQLEA